ncbi:AraC family transcriptional regulator [Alkanindiges hydrocarboniclasticus]|uniref:AraC family transcriptional regulator n=1 Tax=Alkanindiges hydrocarboniclasticus TaxID=1907941 RepID=A0A1S8CXG6_9GAMM|nr:AraC family transcriptional regulator [Alkanindiges hydrocarboniclasticus]
MGKPLHRKMIPETYVQLLFEYLEAQGHDPESVLGEPWPVPDVQGLGGMPVAHWDQLLQTAKQHLNDPLIGLHVGQTITARHLGILGSVLLACDNFGALMQRFERYQRLIFDVVPASIDIGPAYIELTWDIQDYQAGGLVDETGRTVMVQFCRSLIRGTTSLLAVHFIHEQPADIKPYEDYFGCPVLFEQPKPLLRFGLNMLSLPLKSPDPALIAVLDQHADQLLARLPQVQEIVEQVRKQIAYLLRQGEPDIAQLADLLCCSRRTLQRRLTEAGTSFRRELNMVRHELARFYLQDPRLQIVDIALLLGYSEHSAFTRAYKEWTGHTPQQERELQSIQATPAQISITVDHG